MKAGWLGLAVLLVAADTAEADRRSGCSDSIITTAPSRDGAWRAEVDRSICEGGGFAATVLAVVRLAAAGDLSHPVTLLNIDTGGDDSQRPAIVWTGDGQLRVTVPNLSFLRIMHRNVGSVRVDVRFDPPDPAARARWLRALDARDRGE